MPDESLGLEAQVGGGAGGLIEVEAVGVAALQPGEQAQAAVTGVSR